MTNLVIFFVLLYSVSIGTAIGIQKLLKVALEGWKQWAAAVGCFIVGLIFSLLIMEAIDSRFDPKPGILMYLPVFLAWKSIAKESDTRAKKSELEGTED